MIGCRTVLGESAQVFLKIFMEQVPSRPGYGVSQLSVGPWVSVGRIVRSLYSPKSRRLIWLRRGMVAFQSLSHLVLCFHGQLFNGVSR